MKSYRLYLIRHGLTQGNQEGIFAGGNLDIPLCKKGEDGLRKLAESYEYPSVPLVFSSPMKRAMESAQILYPDVKEKIILENLRENCFGEFEGKTMEELKSNEHFASWLNPKSNYVPQGGESGSHFAQRTAQVLLHMMRHLAQNGISQAACVTHGGVIMSMLSQIALPRQDPQAWMCDNGCGFTLRADAGMLMRDGLVEVMESIPLGYRGPQGEDVIRKYYKK